MFTRIIVRFVGWFLLWSIDFEVVRTAAPRLLGVLFVVKRAALRLVG